MSPTIILGIESSCDDTSASVIRDGVMLSNVIANQAVHASFGGVVPELASRAHQLNIIPVVHEALKRAGITKNQLSAVAFTRGPGLLGSLLVGTSTRNSISRRQSSTGSRTGSFYQRRKTRWASTRISVSLPSCFRWKFPNCISKSVQRYGSYWANYWRCCRWSFW